MNSYQKSDIEDKASAFRIANGFGQTDPIRLDSFLLKKNIITIFKPLSQKLAGMAIKADGMMFMMVNSEHSVGKQHFTIAHEMYHLFIQEDFTFQKCITGLFDSQTDIEEKKADYFAANLLMPKLGVAELIPATEKQKKNQISAETLFKIQQYYSVSIKALIYRLCDLKFIDSSYFDLYKTGLTSKAITLGYEDKLYLKGNENKKIGDYGALAINLYASGKISESYYLELLNAIEIDPFVKGEQDGE